MTNHPRLTMEYPLQKGPINGMSLDNIHPVLFGKCTLPLETITLTKHEANPPSMTSSRAVLGTDAMR